MSNEQSASSPMPSGAPPLSWPPPGLERLQGRLWRVIGVAWIGSIVLVLPLLWELATEQPFWSLGPFEDNWQIGMAINLLGLAILLGAAWTSYGIMTAAARAADQGYGTLTILEVATDVTRDTGFLIQGKRHFASLDPERRGAIVQARIRGAGLLLGGAVWLGVGFAVAVLLAARGFVTPRGIWLMTMGPTGLMLLGGLVTIFFTNQQVRAARAAWDDQEGLDHVAEEAASWSSRLDEAGDGVVLGGGAKGEAARFRRGALAAVILFLVVFVPSLTVAITATIGPVLAQIAVPTFLSVQEMAGAAEVLRRYRMTPDPDVPAAEAGAALHSLAFVGGSTEPEEWEQPPKQRFDQGWFPDPDRFPDPFSETVARDLVATPLGQFSPEEQVALRQAASHPAHEEFHLLSRARLVDVVSGRWTLPFPDTLTFPALPWPRFAAYRTAGLAQVARAAVELADGDATEAEATLRELISTGFLLIDQGPTLIDNLMGVVLANMGGDALEELYRRTGRAADADALAWARESAAAAARKSRAGHSVDNLRSLLQEIPDLVEEEDALRGLRWEYLATFNTLAPCINLQKMVFGPDETYTDWLFRARDSLVRVQGERALFELAGGSATLTTAPELEGFLPRFLSLTLGSRGRPGSCASLIARFEHGGGA